MPEVFMECERTARKAHSCDYCGKLIEPGEKYNYAKLKYDDFYEWKCHLKCHYIASVLWNYIDPDEGMTDEDFQEGCQEFCRTFICPDCVSNDEGECLEDNSYCISKIYDFLQTHDFRRVSDNNGWTHTFKCFPKTDINQK